MAKVGLCARVRTSQGAHRQAYARRPHEGLSWSAKAACVNTLSPGRRLTRPAPLRMAAWLTAEMPLRLLRMLPASLMVSFSLNLRGGAKSRPVNVLDLRSK